MHAYLPSTRSARSSRCFCTVLLLAAAYGITASACADESGPEAGDCRYEASACGQGSSCIEQLDGWMCAPGEVVHASEEIGPDGGTLTLDGTVLEIPEGALDRTVEVSMTLRPGGVLGGVDDFRSSLMEFEPTGLTFAVPGTLEIPTSEASGARFGVLWETSHGTNLVPSSVSGDRVVAEVNHFSRAAVKELLPSTCFWDPTRRDYGPDCESQVIDSPLVCAVLTWDDPDSPKTTLAFGNNDPTAGHIKLEQVVVEGTNVQSTDAGTREIPSGDDTGSWAWLWEVGMGIDDDMLPAQWQNHTRHPFPREFQVWPEDHALPMDYCAAVTWGLLSTGGYETRNTTCCYRSPGEPSGEAEICTDIQSLEGTFEVSEVPYLCDGSEESLHTGTPENVRSNAQAANAGIVDLGIAPSDEEFAVVYGWLDDTLIGGVETVTGDAGGCGLQRESWVTMALGPGSHTIRLEAFESEECTRFARPDEGVYETPDGEVVLCPFGEDARVVASSETTIEVEAGTCEQLQLDVARPPAEAVLTATINGEMHEFFDVNWSYNFVNNTGTTLHSIRGWLEDEPDGHSLRVGFPAEVGVGSCTEAYGDYNDCSLLYVLPTSLGGPDSARDYHTGGSCPGAAAEIVVTRLDDIVEGTFTGNIATPHGGGSSGMDERQCSDYVVTEGYFRFPAR